MAVAAIGGIAIGIGGATGVTATAEGTGAVITAADIMAASTVVDKFIEGAGNEGWSVAPAL